MKLRARSRRPSSALKLLPNLEFPARMRARKEFNFYGLRFAVQRQNFREMPEFVELGRKLGVDGIWFQWMVNFASFTPAKLMEADIAWPGHPRRLEFRQVLEHPSMRDRWSTCSSSLPIGDDRRRSCRHHNQKGGRPLDLPPAWLAW